MVCNKPLSYADHCLKFKYVNVNQETIIKAMALIRINGASIPFFYKNKRGNKELAIKSWK